MFVYHFKEKGEKLSKDGGKIPRKEGKIYLQKLEVQTGILFENDDKWLGKLWAVEDFVFNFGK